MIPNKIVILMSTYNGERYLRAQIESIIHQTYSDWTLIIRDDGSTDRTQAIIQAFVKRDARICVCHNAPGNLKTAQSFSVLLDHFLQHTDADYVCFADQDDVWQENKLDSQIDQLQRLTTTYGTNTPALVFSDATVVTANLETIHPSFLQFSHLTLPVGRYLPKLLVSNYMPGCTIAMNRALASASYPIPQKAIMHDWWVALCAASLGQIAFIDKTLLFYRQHENNIIGVMGYKNKLRWMLTRKNFLVQNYLQQKNLFLQRIAQANALLLHLKAITTAKKIALFASLNEKNTLSRLILVCRERFLPDGLARKLMFLYCCIGQIKNEKNN
jgi:glycosyltransferase involved in cell wall biosynthesis